MRSLLSCYFKDLEELALILPEDLLEAEFDTVKAEIEVLNQSITKVTEKLKRLQKAYSDTMLLYRISGTLKDIKGFLELSLYLRHPEQQDYNQKKCQNLSDSLHSYYGRRALKKRFPLPDLMITFLERLKNYVQKNTQGHSTTSNNRENRYYFGKKSRISDTVKGP